MSVQLYAQLHCHRYLENDQMVMMTIMTMMMMTMIMTMIMTMMMTMMMMG